MTLPYPDKPSADYRYGFQGQEKDDELKGEGNSLNYTFRMHDPRVGRFFAVDPLESKYPFFSPYQFSANTPIMAVELEGLESSNDPNPNQVPTTVGEDVNIVPVARYREGKYIMEIGVSENLSNRLIDNNDQESIYSKILNSPGSDLGAINLYNSFMRSKYIKDVARLEPLYDDVWKQNPSNQIGLDKRYNLKLNTRNNLIAGQGKMFEMLEPMEFKPLTNAKGNVTRFHQTRGLVNTMNKFSKAGGLLAVGTSVIRIANAEDKVKETAIVAGGLAGGWAAMTATAGISAQVGLWASTVTTPLGGILIGGAVSITFGVIGAMGGEAFVKAVIE